MNLLEELKKRKIINNITNEEKAKKFFKNKGSLYIGFDPSFHSLHVGNLIMIILLRKFNDAGFKTYAILGGATGMIGDPSGKNSERTLLSKEKLVFNLEKISKQLVKYTKSEIINNYDFYKEMNALDFLRDVGKYININSMLEKDIIRNRLNVGISYTEFSYSILQAYDFYSLWKNNNINLQIGGSDQWSNITSGVDLIKRKDSKNEAFGMTINLLTKKDGKKFGKSEEGAIYLDETISSPYEMYQFFYNQMDDDIENIFYFFSFLSFIEIEKIIKIHREDPKKRIAQKEISYEIVSFIHGENVVKDIIKINELIFKRTFDQFTIEQFKMLSQSNLSILIKEIDMKLVDLLILLNYSTSKSESRKLIVQNSIKINCELINDVNYVLNKNDTYFNKYLIIQKGKRDFKLIKWEK